MALSNNAMESILQAMDIIAGSKVNQVSYDSTAICTIVDDSDKKNGCYIVTNGTIDFKAYSEVTNYKNGEQVRVSIPNGDYTQNKYIEGKYVTDNNTSPITYTSPLDSVLDMANLSANQDGTQQNITGNLVVNKVDPAYPTGIDIWHTSLDNDLRFQDLQENNIYDTLFLQADFRSLLNNKKIRSGSYGLRLELSIRTNSKTYPYITHSLYLDSSEMLGNPYSFTVFTAQAKKFNIAKMGIIDKMTLYFYQNNDFTYYNGSKVITLPVETDKDGKEIENLFVKNIYLGFGSDIEAITDNTIQLYSSNPTDFQHFVATEETNMKDIGFLWYNKNEDNQYLGFSDGIVHFNEDGNIENYDEINYLQESKENARLITQKGKEIPTDKIGLKLSADIEEAVPILKATSKLITSDLSNTLKAFRDRIRVITEFADFEDQYIRVLPNIAQELDKQQNNVLDYYTKGLKRAAAIQKAQIAGDTDFQPETAPEALDYLNNIKTIFNDLNNLLYNTQDIYAPIDRLVNFIPNIKNKIYSTYQGFSGIYDTYASRVNKIFNTLIENLQQLEILLQDQSQVVNYTMDIDIVDYIQKDFSNYDNKYCVYWYRYVKGYYDEDEPFMDKEWQRFTPEYEFYTDSKTKITLPQNTGLPTTYWQDGSTYYFDKKPSAGEGMLRISLDPMLKEEKFMVVLFYNHEMFKSNELVFTNIDTFDDPTTVDKADALYIEHGKNSLETYQSLYSANNFLNNSKDASVVRELRVRYNGLLHKDEALVGAQVYWYIPNNTTMIAVDAKNLCTKRGFKSDYPRAAVVIQDGQTYQIPKADDNRKSDKYSLGETITVYGQNNGFYSIKENNSVGKFSSSWINQDDLEFIDSEYYREGYTCFYKQISSLEEDIQFYYKIQEYYSPTFLRNTIFCLVEKNGYPFETDISLTFGVLGTSGTDYTLMVVPSTSQVAVKEDTPLPLTVALYDYNNEPIKLYSNKTTLKPGTAFNTRVEWMGPKTYVFNLIQDESDQSICGGEVISAPNSAEHTGIAKVITSFMRGAAGEAEENNNEVGKRYRQIDLTTLYPIAWSIGDYYIEGATSVVYDSSGKNPNYYKNPYRIFKANTNEELTDNVVWTIKYFIGENGKVPIELASNKAEYNIYMSYMPVINDKNGLTPCNMYIGDINCYPVVQCFVNGTLYWSQPIVIIQNRYPSAMLNSWDGSLTIDEKNGTILSTMIGAGRKTANNTFEGVLMGDIAAGAGFDLNNKSGLGIYGFHDGAQSFGFNIDGTAFLGKSGRGRIEIDGNKGTISSASYQQDNSAGMMIDLDDGFINIRGTKQNANGNYASDGTQSRIRLDVKSPYVQIIDQNGKNLLYVAKDNYYLQTSNYEENVSGTRIDLQVGKIDSYNFELTAGSSLQLNSNPGINQNYFAIGNNSNYIRLKKVNDSGDTNLSISSKIFTLTAGSSPRNIIIDSQASAYPLSIGNNFKVTWDGTLTATGANLKSATVSGTITTNNINATGGLIGGCIIKEGSISGSGWTLSSDGAVFTGISIRDTDNATPIKLFVTSATVYTLYPQTNNADQWPYETPSVDNDGNQGFSCLVRLDKTTLSNVVVCPPGQTLPPGCERASAIATVKGVKGYFDSNRHELQYIGHYTVTPSGG